MEKSKSEELENKVLEIGKKYKKADKLTKIEVGKKMLGKRRVTKRKIRNKGVLEWRIVKKEKKQIIWLKY